MPRTFVSLIVAFATTFMASLSGICATLCTFKVCADTASVVKTCCSESSRKEEAPLSKCRQEMNKETPPVTKGKAFVCSFDFAVWILPSVPSIAIVTVESLPKTFLQTRGHAPPETIRVAFGPRAPPFIA